MNLDTTERFDVDHEGVVYVMADVVQDIYDMFGERTVLSVERIGVGYVLASHHANGGTFAMGAK